MTAIRVLQPGDEAALEAFLLPRIETSMFLLGNMRAVGLVDGGGFLEGSYVAANDGDKIVGVVAHYWNDNLIVQAPVHVEALCKAAIEASGRRVGGLIGPAEQVQAAKNALAVAKDALDLAGGAIQLDETEYLYSLALADLLVPEGLRTGRLVGRRLQPRDADQVTEWLVAFALESLGEENSPQLWERTRANTERKVEQGTTWILEDGGRPVSTSGFNTTTAEAVQIGGCSHRRSFAAAGMVGQRSRPRCWTRGRKGWSRRSCSPGCGMSRRKSPTRRWATGILAPTACSCCARRRVGRNKSRTGGVIA